MKKYLLIAVAAIALYFLVFRKKKDLTSAHDAQNISNVSSGEFGSVANSGINMLQGAIARKF